MCLVTFFTLYGGSRLATRVLQESVAVSYWGLMKALISSAWKRIYLFKVLCLKGKYIFVLSDHMGSSGFFRFFADYFLDLSRKARK